MSQRRGQARNSRRKPAEIRRQQSGAANQVTDPGGGGGAHLTIYASGARQLVPGRDRDPRPEPFTFPGGL